jgi:putative transcriptional regulator
MKKTLLAAAHEMAKGLFDVGLMDAKKMRSFDILCLPPARKLSPKKIKQIRLREKISQHEFAEFLNIRPSTIQKWETGEKHPTGAALRLLNIVAHKGLQALLYDENA